MADKKPNALQQPLHARAPVLILGAFARLADRMALTEDPREVDQGLPLGGCALLGRSGCRGDQHGR